MATLNPFDLLGDDVEDPSLIAAKQVKQAVPVTSDTKKAPAKAKAQVQPAKPVAKLPSKPLPPSEAVREFRNESQRGGGRGGPRGGGRGGPRGRGRGFNQEFSDGDNTFGSNNGFPGAPYKAPEDGDSGRTFERRGGYGGGGSRGGYRGGRRGGFNNEEASEGDRPRRVYDRRSGTGRGNDFKREGAGRANWGTPTDEIAPETEEPVNEVEKIVDSEKQGEQEDAGDAKKDSPAAEPEEKEPEEKQMTLEEYEKVLEEKRQALLALKPEERKVNLDKDFENMQLLSNKKNDDETFVKLGSEKDKRKETVEKAKKTKSINEFLKSAEGENYYRGGGRGRGRGRGRGGYGGNGSNYYSEAPKFSATKDEDVGLGDAGKFPSLGGK